MGSRPRQQAIDVHLEELVEPRGIEGFADSFLESALVARRGCRHDVLDALVRQRSPVPLGELTDDALVRCQALDQDVVGTEGAACFSRAAEGGEQDSLPLPDVGFEDLLGFEHVATSVLSVLEGEGGLRHLLAQSHVHLASGGDLGGVEGGVLALRLLQGLLVEPPLAVDDVGL